MTKELDLRVPYKLNDLIDIAKTKDNYFSDWQVSGAVNIFTRIEDHDLPSPAVECFLDEVLFDDDEHDDDGLSAFIYDNHLTSLCSSDQFNSTIHITIDQKPDATYQDIIDSILYFLHHDSYKSF